MTGGGQRRRRRGWRSVEVAVPPTLGEVLDAVAALRRQSSPQAASSLLLAGLAEARADPIVQAALAARRGSTGLHVVRGAGPVTDGHGTQSAGRPNGESG